jgi:type IV secretion system protein VirD4
MTPEQRASQGGEIAAAAVLGLLAAIGFMFWAATGLSAVAFGGGWPRMTFTAIADALGGLPGHLADPRLAWPAADRARMAGPVGFYLVAGAMSLLVAAAVWGAVQHRRPRDAVGSGDGGAKWATSGELGALRSHRPGRRLQAEGHGPTDQRLGLGYRGRRLLRAEARHALIVFGPPQSGKSAGIAIPALLEWQGPVVASSVKTDLFAATARRRGSLGAVKVFDPFGLSPAVGSTWSPLAAANTWDGALSTALRMTAAGELDTGDVKGGGYWAAAAEQRLAPLLWAGAHLRRGMGAVVRWAYGQGDAELPAILHDLLDRAGGTREFADAQAAHDAHSAFEALAGETRSSIESTVQMLLRAYRSPRVQASAISSEISGRWLLSGANTLYLIGDSHRGKLLRPIFLALLQELVDHAYHDATVRGGQLRLPLLLCLDELGNVAPLPNLADIATTAPSHNIQLISIFHDVAQARGKYREQVQTVINSHRARMLLPGVADLETLRYFSDLLGEVQPRLRDGKLQGERLLRQPLAAPQQLRQLAEGESLLIYGRLPPARLRLRAYYRDRRLRALAEESDERLAY